MRWVIFVLLILFPSSVAALPTNYQQARFEWQYDDAGWGAQYFQFACGTTPGIYTRLGSTANATVRTASISIAVPKSNGRWYCIIRGVRGTQVTPQSSPPTTLRVDGNWVYE